VKTARGRRAVRLFVVTHAGATCCPSATRFANLLLTRPPAALDVNVR
jgi:hypothetical protein